MASAPETMASTAQPRFQPFWFDEAIKLEGRDARAFLGSETTADICIVGGGFTGLWSAIKIRQKAPHLKVIIIEKDLCGQGASGRNGGCMLTFSSKLPSLIAQFGLEEATRLVKASENAVLEIAEFCKANGIDGEVRPDGALYTATSTAQLPVLRKPLKIIEQHQLNHWSDTTPAQRERYSGSAAHLDGIYSPYGGSVHPGKLVRGLADIAEKLDVDIYEHTPMQSYHTHQSGKVVVDTARTRITANKLILATNAWTPQIVPQFSRSVVLVSSDMMISPKQPDALKLHGFTGGTAVADSRLFVHYYRNSISGRVMLGKGGNHFSYGNQMTPLFDHSSQVTDRLQNAFKGFFPALDHTIDRSWTGASDRSVSGLPFFGHLPGKHNILYGFGYSGNGVVQSYLGGEFLSSMVLEQDNDWSRSPMAQGIPAYFPPEPFRTLGARMVKHAILRKEKREDAGLLPFWWDKQLAKLAASAGKSG